MIPYVYTLSHSRLRPENCKFKTNLGYKVKPCLIKQNIGLLCWLNSWVTREKDLGKKGLDQRKTCKSWISLPSLRCLWYLLNLASGCIFEFGISNCKVEWSSIICRKMNVSEDLHIFGVSSQFQTDIMFSLSLVP